MFEKVNKRNQITIDIDVFGQTEDDSIQDKAKKVEQPEAKSAIDYIKEELRERSAEKKDLIDAIKQEEERLAAMRQEARDKNILRKIKVVDSAYTKKELARDEQVLSDFKIAEQKKISEARSQRGKEIAKKNKKSIAAALASILVACGAFGGIATHSHNVAIAENYNYAVSCIVSGQYQEAANTLDDLDYSDSDVLYDYAYALSLLDLYSGEPDKILDRMPNIESIENDEIRQQYAEAYRELQLADEIQDKIDGIKLTSVEDISKKSLSEIKTQTAKLDEKYRVLLSTDSYDLAVRVLDNIRKNTEAGRLIADIDNLEEVTLDSKKVLSKLRKTYNNLSDDDKELILNYKKLDSAESKYAALKAKEEERIAAEKKAEEERIAAEKKAEEKRLAEEARAAEEARLAAEAATKEQMVWVSANGNCYHSRSSCSNMKDPWQVPISQAEKSKRACKKCW